MSSTLYVVDFSAPDAEAIKVTIQTGDDVTALKKSILAEWGSGLAAGNIRLWKPNSEILLTREARVKVLTGTNLQQIAVELSLADDLHSLSTADVRANLVVEVLRSTTATSSTLYVVDFSAPDAEAIEITIQTGDNVTALKKSILKAWGSGFAERDLCLWKPDVKIPLAQDSQINALTNANLEAIATRVDLIDDIHLLVPCQKSDIVNVIAKVVMVQKEDAMKELDESQDTLGALNAHYKSMVQNALASKSPSVSSHLTEYRNTQGGQYPIYDGRYDPTRNTSTITLPIQLYNPVFARFINDAANPDLKIPESVVLATAKLMYKASGIYSDETARSTAIRPALKDALSYGLSQSINDDKSQSDHAILWTLSAVDGSFNEVVLLMLEEEKRELGEGGCDASTQASFSMRRYWAQRTNDVIRAQCCCPTFLVAFAGPWLCVLGAVMTDKCIVQRLTDFIWIGAGSVLNDAHCHRVARVMHSLTQSLGDLKAYYAGLKRPSNGLGVLEPIPSRYFPFTTSFLSDDNQPTENNQPTETRFEYLKAMESDATCVTFLCKTLGDDSRSIVVKFVQTYGREAHKLLAANNMAPQLLYCGSIDPSKGAPSYGPLQMVVMEYVDGTTVAELKKLPDTFGTQLTATISVLHCGGYVYVDLRPQNIMVMKDGTVKLIDFDWAGKVGEVKYPLNLSPNISWPEGVVSLGEIKMEHDIQMLNNCIL